MIDIKKMKQSEDKNINLYFIDGRVWKNKKCLYFENEVDEEPMINIWRTDNSVFEIKQSEIERIEILD